MVPWSSRKETLPPVVVIAYATLANTPATARTRRTVAMGCARRQVRDMNRAATVPSAVDAACEFWTAAGTGLPVSGDVAAPSITTVSHAGQIASPSWSSGEGVPHSGQVGVTTDRPIATILTNFPHFQS